MEKQLSGTTASETASAKIEWTAPEITETDIESITMAGTGSSGDGVTTSS